MVPNNELIAEMEYCGSGRLRGDFADQLGWGKEGYLFQRLNWFEMLHTHCFPDHPPLIFRAQEGNAEALLLLRDEVCQLVAYANYYSFNFAPIFLNTDDPKVKEKLLVRIARDLRRQHRRIGMFPVLDDEEQAGMLVRAFRKAGWIAMASDLAHNHILRTQGQDFDSYWQARPSRLRKSVKKKSRNLPFSFAIEQEMSDGLWQDYLRIYAASWKKEEAHPDLLRALCEDASARGALRMGVARLEDGTAIAIQLWTLEQDIALFHKMAHDSAYDSHSPGTLLAHHMFRHMIDREKVSLIDYGTGDNSYKREWMNEERPMFRIDCFHPLSPTMWLPAARTAISRVVGRRNGR